MPSKTLEILKILGLKKVTKLEAEVPPLNPGVKLGEGKSPFPRIQ